MKDRKWKFIFPDTGLLLLGMIVFAAVLTYIVPAGAFERMLNESTGSTLVVAGTYESVAQNPIGLMGLFTSLFDGMMQGSELAWFVILAGGGFGVLMRTGAIMNALNALIRKLAGKESFMIVIVMTSFFLAGASYGSAEEMIPLVAVIVPIAIKMGYDGIVGVSMIVVGLYSGYSAGPLNPYNVGIAQSICELPIFSGLGLRTVFAIGALLIAMQHTISYAKRIKVDEEHLRWEELPESISKESVLDEKKLDGKNIAILLTLTAAVFVLVFSVIKLGWWLGEISALFLMMGLVSGMIHYKCKFTPIVSDFLDGCKDMLLPALYICFARSILVVLSDASVLDTLIYWVSIPLEQVPPAISAIGMYFAMALVNFVIPSSSGQAVVTMPILSGLADLVGVTRQVAVTAFASGDGFWNMITPTHPVLMGMLGVAGVSFSKWFKFAWKLVLKWTIWICAFLVFAVMIEWGPF